MMARVYNKHYEVIPEGAVYIGRPSEWGNPFMIDPHRTREEAVNLYLEYVMERPELMERIKTELKGKDLVCFCSPKICHGDILLAIANN